MFFEKIYNKYICLNLKDYSNIGFDLEINKLLFFITLGLIAACIIINYSESNVALMLKKLLRTESIGESNAKTLSDLGLERNYAVKFALSRSGGIINKIVRIFGKKTPTYEEYLEAERAKREAKRLARESKRKNKSSAANTSSASNTTSSEIMDEPANADTSDTVAASVSDELTENADGTVTANTAVAESATDTEPTEDTPTSAVVSADGKIDFEHARFYIAEDMKDYAEKYFSRKSTSVLKTALSCLLLFGFYVGLMFAMPTIISGINAMLATGA